MIVRVVGAEQRLEVDRKLVGAAQRLAQLGLDGVPVLQQLVHRLFEDDGAVAAGGLGFVERDIGFADQLARVGFVAVGGGDADRDADEGLAAEDVERLADGVDDALAQTHRLGQAWRRG